MAKRINKSEKTSQKPDVFRFHDYREFLTAQIAFLKSSSKLSQRALAKKSNLSAAYLPLVLSGKRTLTAESLLKLLPHLGLDGEEKRYLELLRTLSESTSMESRYESFEQIKEMRGYRHLNPQEVETYQYLSQWFIVAIREMATLPGFNLNPQWIQSKLRSPTRLGEIRNAIDFLLTHGYVIQSPNGKITLPEKDLDCVGGIFRLALGKFHAQMLDVTRELMTHTPREERKLSGYTFAGSKEGFSKVRDILDNALDEIRKVEEKDAKQTEHVYHVTVMAVPLTGGLKESNDEK